MLEVWGRHVSVDLVGQRFGRLTVVRQAEAYVGPSGKRRPRVLCVCDCGAEWAGLRQSLRNGNTQSCGCLQRERAAAKMVAVGRGNRRAGRISYSSAHKRVRTTKGSARKQPCIDCGQPAREWSYTHADPGEWSETHPRTGRPVAYSGDPFYYAARCSRCHTAFDRRLDG